MLKTLVTLLLSEPATPNSSLIGLSPFPLLH